MLLNVPHDRTGQSAECPRCKNLFTVAAMINPPKELPPARKRTAAPGKSAAVTSLAEGRAPAAINAKSLFKNEATSTPPFVAQKRLGLARVCGAAAVIAGVLAILLSLLPSTQDYILPSSIGGLVLGVVGLWLLGTMELASLPAAGLCACIPGMLLGVFWPDLLELPAGSSNTSRDLTLKAIPIDSSKKAYIPAAYERLDASQWAFQQGDMRVTITGANVKPVQIKDMRGQVKSKEKSLEIQVRVQNVSNERSIPYVPWQSGPGINGSIFLCDSNGKVYHLNRSAVGPFMMGMQKTVVGPNGFVDDVIIFEPPGKSVVLFDLELPATAIDGSGRLKFEIPGSMLTSR
jgi:hypothetical protein